VLVFAAAEQVTRFVVFCFFLEAPPMNLLMNRVLTSFVSLFNRKSTIRILAIPAFATFALLAAATLAPAQTSAPLDKHARRIEKRLTKYRQGTFLDFQFRDSSQTFGSLGQLSEASFQFTDADSNKTQTHYYSELAHVTNAKEYIGEGSEPRHHIHLLVPVIIGAGIAAGGIAAYEILH
jgi:hypothetical protein